MPHSEQIEPSRNLPFIGQRQSRPNLEAAPYGAIQQLGVVCRRYEDHVAWQPVYLQEQRVKHTLDLPRLLAVFALLAQRIELIEEKDTLSETRVLENFLDALCRLSKVAVHDSLVPNDEKGNAERRRDCFG
jgi:hypothetical protein